jgi:hypothetical protein
MRNERSVQTRLQVALPGKRAAKRPNRTSKQHPVMFRKRQGFGTLEVVIIIAVLLSVALIFRAALTDFAQNLIQTVFSEKGVLEELTENSNGK